MLTDKVKFFAAVEKFKKQIAIAAASVTDSVASRCVDLFGSMKYDGALIKAGTRIKWENGLKRAAVDLWDREENSPANAPTLWEDIAYYMGYRIIPETITAPLAFSAGEIGYWPADGKFYRAKNDGTVWTPAAYAAAWDEVDISD